MGRETVSLLTASSARQTVSTNANVSALRGLSASSFAVQRQGKVRRGNSCLDVGIARCDGERRAQMEDDTLQEEGSLLSRQQGVRPFCPTSAPVRQISGLRNGGFLAHRNHQGKRAACSLPAACCVISGRFRTVRGTGNAEGRLIRLRPAGQRVPAKGKERVVAAKFVTATQ